MVREWKLQRSFLRRMFSAWERGKQLAGARNTGVSRVPQAAKTDLRWHYAASGLGLLRRLYFVI
jgi:hypothetical protein